MLLVIRSSSYVTLFRLLGKGCGCESLSKVVLLGNSASSRVRHLQEAMAYQVISSCVSEFCSQWAYLTLWSVLMESVLFFCVPFTCQLACSHAVPCFATKGLIFCFVCLSCVLICQCRERHLWISCRRPPATSASWDDHMVFPSG